MCFTEACFVLCFGFMVKTGLTIQGVWLVIAEQHQVLFCFSHHPTSEQAGACAPVSRQGVLKKLGRNTAWTTDQRDTPHHTTSCSVNKRWENEEGQRLGVTVFVSPGNCYT